MKMNKGIIRITDCAWSHRITRKTIKRDIRIIRDITDTEDMIQGLRCFLCKSKKFSTEPMEGQKIPEYGLIIEGKDVKFLWFRRCRFYISEVEELK